MIPTPMAFAMRLKWVDARTAMLAITLLLLRMTTELARMLRLASLAMAVACWIAMMMACATRMKLRVAKTQQHAITTPALLTLATATIPLLASLIATEAV